MITMHARPRLTNRRTDGQWTSIMPIARRFVLANASRAKNCGVMGRVGSGQENWTHIQVMPTIQSNEG